MAEKLRVQRAGEGALVRHRNRYSPTRGGDVKVRATSDGEYGDAFRVAGEVFELLPRPGMTVQHQFSGRWMVDVHESTAVGRPPVQIWQAVPPPESVVGARASSPLSLCSW